MSWQFSGQKDDPVFIDRPGVDVVDVDDPVNSEQVLFDLVVVEAGPIALTLKSTQVRSGE